MTLPLPPTPVPAPESPLDLYERLQVTEPGLSDLWVHQGNALQTYRQTHVEHHDVALELPTGSGKTLVGLLIGEWRRLALNQRVAYACVNNQLAEHVAAKASRYGIDVVLLTGPHRGWDNAAVAAFRAGDAVAISNYHHVFNYWSALAEAQTLIFDDAHGGEDPVADTWSIRAVRRDEPGLHAAILGVVRDALSGPFASILANVDEVDPRRDRIELVPPTVVAERAERLQHALEGAIDQDAHNGFALRAIAGAIGRCLVYVSAREILIRPFIPPTRDLAHFAEATQRLYMSATLGAGGELERAFGVHKIRRIPADATQQRSGRRLILMPGLRIDEGPAGEVIREAITATPRTAMIAPSTRALEEATDSLLQPFIPTMDANQIQEFIETEPAVLALANRYDGIDLPDRQCRLIVLSGLPAYGHSQERFLFETVGATRVLTERIRTRIIQGAGRATRNRQDYAAVLLRGDDLLRFIQRDEARSEMRPELQVELEVGEYYSRNNDVEFADILRTFWTHGQDWQPIETHLREQIAGRQRTDDPVSIALAKAAPHEVQAWWFCWQGNLSGAADEARAAITQLVGESLRPYRAIWEYFAASWAIILATEQPQSDAPRAAAQLRQSAEATARTLRWFPRFSQDPNQFPIGPDYDARAERATQWMRQVNTRSRRFDETIARITEQVYSDDPDTFHRGLHTLGLALGFESWCDNNSPACPDGAWRDDDRLWILFEAKTLQQAGTPLAANHVRQANSHDNWMQANQDWTPTPTQLITAIISPRETLATGAQTVADPDVTLVHPQIVRSIADRTVALLGHLRGLPAALTDTELTQSISLQLVEHQLDNRSLTASLAQRTIRNMQQSR